MILKNNRKDIWTCMENAIYFALTFSFFILFNNAIQDKEYYIVFSIVIYLILLCPAIILLTEYILKNKGNEIIIGINSIVVRSNVNVEKNYFIKDINYILYAKPAHLDDKIYIPFTMHDKFHFIKIVFDSGDELFITSIMKFESNEVIKLFDPNKVIRVKSVFSSLSRSYSSYVKRFIRSKELDEIFVRGRQK